MTIILHERLNPRRHQAIDSIKPCSYQLKASSTMSLPVISFDPAQCYFEELKVKANVKIIPSANSQLLREGGGGESIFSDFVMLGGEWSAGGCTDRDGKIFYFLRLQRNMKIFSEVSIVLNGTLTLVLILSNRMVYSNGLKQQLTVEIVSTVQG